MIEAPKQQANGTPKTELDRLMEAAAQDARREPEFFRALLDAVLYAHVPIDDKFAQMGDGANRVRLVMFKSPDDGTLVIPVFTDEGKAEWAARGGVRVLAVTGREFLEGTRGATLMFNPNDHRFTLYPEETAALLADSTLPPIERDKLEENQARTYKLPRPPAALVTALKTALPSVPGIELAYIAGVKWKDPDRRDSVLVALLGRPGSEEREARATAIAMQQAMERLNLPIDIMHFDSNEPKPAWITHLGLKPVYRRRPLSRAPSRFN